MRENQIKALQLINPLNVYSYGSRVYGCNKPDSDFDYIIITEGRTFDDPSISMVAYSVDDFKAKMAEHEISALECLFLSSDLIVKQDVRFDFSLDLTQLRKSISAKSDNSFVKTKKKFDVEREVYIAKKSLFHALRVVIFGTQIAAHGRITEYSAANHYWNDIMANTATDWESYRIIYKPIFNCLKTAFREATPK